MRITSARTGFHFAAPVVVLVVVLCSCALGRPSPSAFPAASATVLSEQQIAATLASTVYEAIQRLHPVALKSGAARSLQPLVYLDRMRLGGVGELTKIPAVDIAQIRFLSSLEASAMFGPTPRSAGAILLTSKIWSRSADQ